MKQKILFWFDIGMDVGTRILIGVMREGPLLLAKSYESEKDHCYLQKVSNQRDHCYLQKVSNQRGTIGIIEYN